MFSPYIPPLICLLLSFLVIRIPAIAVFLVSGALFIFSIIYAAIVFRMQRARKQYENYQKTYGGVDGQNSDFSNFQNMEKPSFQHVSTLILKNGKWTKED